MFNLNLILNDAPQPWQIGFQDSAAPGFSGIVELHNTLIILFILFFIFNYNFNVSLNILDFLVLSKRSHDQEEDYPNKRFKHNHLTDNDPAATPPLEDDSPGPSDPASGGPDEVTDEDLVIQTILMDEIHESSELLKSADITDDIKVEAINRIISLSRQYAERGGRIYDLELAGLIDEEDSTTLNILREALGPGTLNDGTGLPNHPAEAGTDEGYSDSAEGTQESNNSISIGPSRPKGGGGSDSAGPSGGGGPSTPGESGGAGPQSGNTNYSSIQDMCLYLLILLSNILEHIELLLEHMFNKFS